MWWAAGISTRQWREGGEWSIGDPQQRDKGTTSVSFLLQHLLFMVEMRPSWASPGQLLDPAQSRREGEGRALTMSQAPRCLFQRWSFLILFIHPARELLLAPEESEAQSLLSMMINHKIIIICWSWTLLAMGSGTSCLVSLCLSLLICRVGMIATASSLWS